jgi:hypothetical protein
VKTMAGKRVVKIAGQVVLVRPKDHDRRGSEESFSPFALIGRPPKVITTKSPW